MAYTQYSLVDIDGLEEGQAEQLMERLKEDPYWLLAYITLSGKGLRIIFQVKGGTDSASYLKAFFQGNNHYCQLLGITQFDAQVKDDSRASGMCHDPNALYRAEAKVFKVDYDKVVVAEVWDGIEKSLKTRGYAYEPGHHNEYISQAGYLLNAYGVEEDEATGWLKRRFPDYDPARIESHIRSCYSTRANEHATLQPGNRPQESRNRSPERQKQWKKRSISVWRRLKPC